MKSDTLFALGSLVALFAVGWVLVGGGTDVPVVDDWVYAWSVQHLLETGELRVLGFSAVYPLAQVAWGALFARGLGFSFAALRASTVALTVLGCWSVYLTLGELGCRRRTRLLGAFALALDPAYFAFSYSFNTDVPFADVSAIAIYWYVSAVGRNQPGRLWIGGLFSVAAFLIRPIAIVLPAAVVPAMLWRRGPWDIRSIARAALPLAAPLAAMALLRITIHRVLPPLDWEAIREGQLRWWFWVPAASYLRWTLGVVVVSVFPFAPLFLAAVARRRRALVTAAVALVLVVPLQYVYGSVPTPLPDWQTWSLQDIAARALVAGDLGPSAWSVRAMPWVRGLGLLTLAAFLVIVIRPLARRPRWGRGESIVVAVALLHGAFIHVLWLYNDRYYLALAPELAILGALALDEHGRAQWLAAALLVVWAAIAVTGTRDMLAFNEACARAARSLEASGIPPWDIDAGYPLNGWRLYAHPENLPPGADPRDDVPFVTSARVTPYALMSHPPPGVEVLHVIPLERATWQASREVYVVRRAGEPPKQ